MMPPRPDLHSISKEHLIALIERQYPLPSEREIAWVVYDIEMKKALIAMERNIEKGKKINAARNKQAYLKNAAGFDMLNNIIIGLRVYYDKYLGDVNE